MRWQGPTLALFQLQGIKHCRYAGRRVFVERGKGREKVFYKAHALLRLWKSGLVLFEDHRTAKESGSLAKSWVFRNNVITFFFFSFYKALLTITCTVLWWGRLDFTWLVSPVKMSGKIRVGSYVSLATCMCSIMNLGPMVKMQSSILRSYSLHCTWDSWSAHGLCQVRALKLFLFFSPQHH